MILEGQNGITVYPKYREVRWNGNLIGEMVKLASSTPMSEFMPLPHGINEMNAPGLLMFYQIERLDEDNLADVIQRKRIYFPKCQIMLNYLLEDDTGFGSGFKMPLHSKYPNVFMSGCKVYKDFALKNQGISELYEIYRSWHSGTFYIWERIDFKGRRVFAVYQKKKDTVKYVGETYDGEKISEIYMKIIKQEENERMKK